jgi:hypothetical protein
LLTSPFRKFFGQPNGSKPMPTHQSKLSFGAKPAKKAEEEPEASLNDPSPQSSAVKAEPNAEEDVDHSKGIVKESRTRHQLPNL